MSHGGVPGVHRIVLVGFMAAGKTTVGRRLADRLGWRFVDLDEEIHQRTGRSPGELIRSAGEAEFRRLESVVTREVSALRRLVLSTGGGWVTRPELAALLGDRSVRVWLRISTEETLRRAEADDVDRPLLGDDPDPAERRRRVAGLLEQRTPLYAAAEVVIDVDGKEPDTVVEEIVSRLESELEDDEP